jgi:20S proteasome alpha/beta subunit
MNPLKTGTTTVGLVTKDVVILGADKRATAGDMVADKNITKILAINDRMLVTIAGVVSAQGFQDRHASFSQRSSEPAGEFQLLWSQEPG